MIWFQEESVSEQADKLHSVVNPMDNQDGLGERNPMRLVARKNRALQKYLETLSGYSILVQFEDRSTKRTAILSNMIKRSDSLRHTAWRVHWISDMHEDQGVILRTRVVLQADSQSGSHDLHVQEPRSSRE